MASSKPSPLALKEPEAERRPGDNEAIASLVNSVADTAAPDMIASEHPASKRLVVDAQNISLTFDTADGRVDALSNVSLQIVEGEFVSFIGHRPAPSSSMG